MYRACQGPANLAPSYTRPDARAERAVRPGPGTSTPTRAGASPDGHAFRGGRTGAGEGWGVNRSAGRGGRSADRRAGPVPPGVPDGPRAYGPRGRRVSTTA